MTHNTREIKEKTDVRLEAVRFWEEKFPAEYKDLIERIGEVAISLGSDKGKELADSIKDTITVLHQELQKAVQEENLKHCCCLIEDSKVIERCKLHGDELQKAREEERAIWGQRPPEDTFSVTIEGCFDKRIVANRKFVSMKSISATSGRTLLLEAEACAHQILQSLNQSELDQPTV